MFQYIKPRILEMKRIVVYHRIAFCILGVRASSILNYFMCKWSKNYCSLNVGGGKLADDFCLSEFFLFPLDASILMKSPSLTKLIALRYHWLILVRLSLSDLFPAFSSFNFVSVPHLLKINKGSYSYVHLVLDCLCQWKTLRLSKSLIITGGLQL